MTTSIPPVVKRGAELLDERLPGWDEKIDLETLDLASACNCVLGQVQQGLYPRRKKYDYDSPYSALARELFGEDYFEAVPRFGFLRARSSHTRLTEAWRTLIARRRRGR